MLAGVAAWLRWRERRKAAGKPSAEQHLTWKDWPYTIGMIVLDILAPIFLMIGISRTTAANASLLNNFEIVATSLIALLVFKGKISRRLWVAIGLIVLSSVLLTVEDATSLQFSMGSVFVLLGPGKQLHPHAGPVRPRSRS